MKDQDIEQWAHQLAGATRAKDADPQLDALRSVIEARDRSISDSNAADHLAHARLIKRLEKEGLLKSRPRWQFFAAAAAAVLIAAIGVRITLLPTSTDRGFAGSVTIVAKQPDVTLTQVLLQLEALGLHPKTVEEDGRRFIEVAVSQQQLEAFHAWAQERGGGAVMAGVYRIFIDREAGVTR